MTVYSAPRLRRLIAALTVSTAVAAVLPGTATAAPSSSPPAVAGGEARTVTLITGDRITLFPGGNVALERGAGREHVRFGIERLNGRVSVIPSDARGPLHAGRVDPRLFDVTRLVEFGYHDRALPLLVAGTAPGARAAGSLPGGLSRVEAAPNGATWTTLTGASAQARGGVTKIWLDGVMRPSLDVSVPQIGAPAAWQAGLTGTGTTVAVLDTGIDETHPDLAGRVRAARNFTEGAEDDRDLVGHGTHVASTIAGNGARFKGVAPGATLLDGKVCALAGGCPESAILAGMQWAAEQGADVVNMSLGGFDMPGEDPVEAAVRTLSEEHGTLFVVAAGNSGALGEGSVESPGSADAALTVGAVDKSGKLAGFSSRGPRLDDYAIKPEITAPGVNIAAARSADAVEMTDPGPAEGYTTASGTSMATPHVAGAAALLAQRHPDWPGDRLKSVLVGSATPEPSTPVSAQGAGRVDVARAITQDVTASPAVINAGFQQWPHADDEVRSTTLTYRNGGTAAITLTLGVSGLPDGLVSLSAPAVTVPAGGEASVRADVDTRGEMPDGFLGGTVTATAGDRVVRTPLGVQREVESYDVGLTVLGRDGAPSADHRVQLIDKARRVGYGAWPGSGDTIRLPKGEYALGATIGEDTHLAQAALVVDGGTGALTLDARIAAPVTVTVPRQGASLESLWAGAGSTWYATGVGAAGDEKVYIGRLGPDVTTPDYHSYVTARFGQRAADGTFNGTPYLYSAFYLTPGKMTTGFTHAATQSEFATVEAVHGTPAAVPLAAKGSFPMHDALPGASSWNWLYPAGFRRTEYYNADHGVRWAPYFMDARIGEDGWEEYLSEQWAPQTAYRPGRTVTEVWNRPVFGPALPDTGFPAIARQGDLVYANTPLFGDGGGREGTSVVTSATSTLSRDGQLIQEFGGTYGEWEIPAEAASYRLDVTAERGAPHRLSTRVTASWTFTSAHGTGPVPISTVILTPPVDASGVAPKGRAFSVPVRVAGQANSAAAPNRSLTVEVSYDDGATWSRAAVRDGAVQLRHPATAGFVSLRAVATDRAGGTVTQTVIRAYEIR
ncbi:subtilisin family serine protease [Catenuloplanes nepalensis]|uniref:Subtilisin family serine protease n=1 Tax=Catenuloplanes nepalensis TaxID=587533 RepID=A0ABT9MY59_9ACTN|nr:S8 family serine peptidase [Catenuloplanes nepalensis]MDP9795966.1 subtilisin family serine protease [Catenuloplanes nepalensis]